MILGFSLYSFSGDLYLGVDFGKKISLLIGTRELERGLVFLSLNSVAPFECLVVDFVDVVRVMEPESEFLFLEVLGGCLALPESSHVFFLDSEISEELR